jgi:hypothetical protein
VNPAPHALLQEPQLRSSLCVSVHFPPHTEFPEGHEQTERVQVAPSAHTLPHAPQFCGSLVTSMPGGQGAALLHAAKQPAAMIIQAKRITGESMSRPSCRSCTRGNSLRSRSARCSAA